jgi:hypothetical protein
MTNTPDEQLTQEPQAERGGPGSGEPGSRDTGSDRPSAGPSDRDSGKLDDQAESSDAEDPSIYGGTGELPPQDTNRPYRPTRAVPRPRQTRALALASLAASAPKARRHRRRDLSRRQIPFQGRKRRRRRAVPYARVGTRRRQTLTSAAAAGNRAFNASIM